MSINGASNGCHEISQIASEIAVIIAIYSSLLSMVDKDYRITMTIWWQTDNNDRQNDNENDDKTMTTAMMK